MRAGRNFDTRPAPAAAAAADNGAGAGAQDGATRKERALNAHGTRTERQRPEEAVGWRGGGWVLEAGKGACTRTGETAAVPSRAKTP